MSMATARDDNSPVAGAHHYRPDIDGLRALAILLVVINHYYHRLLPGGFVGVDIFFVISGYLITGILLKSLSDRRLNLVAFYRRRILRLFPALATTLLVTLLVGLLLLSPDELTMLGMHTLAAAGFVVNFVLVGENGYFDLASSLKPLLHLWSLGVEEQFYLFWPVLMLLAFRMRLVFVALLAVFAVSLCLNLANIGSHAVPVFFLPQYRAWEFAAGALLAYLDRHPLLFLPAIRLPAAAIETLAATGLLLLVYSAIQFDANQLYPGWRALLPVCGSVLVIAMGRNSRILAAILGNPVSLYIGRLSYPLYLWHWPLVSLLTILQGTPSVWTAGIAMLASFALAAATYHGVEQPLKAVRKGDGRRQALALIGIILAIALAGLAVVRLDGMPWRLGDRQAIGLTHEDHYVDPQCSALAGEQFNYCRLSDFTQPPTIALLGDSHANHFFDGMAAYAEARGQTVINLGGCTALPDTAIYQEGTVDSCVTLGNAMLAYAFDNPEIETILIASRMAYWISGGGVNGLEAGRTPYVMKRVVDGQDLFGLDALRSGLTDLAIRARQTGKRLIYIYDNAELDFPPASCLSQRPFELFMRQDCSIDRHLVEARQAPYRDVVRQTLAEFPEIGQFDPLDYMCDATRCHALSGQTPLYRDDNHLSRAGSLFLADKYSFLAGMDGRAPI